MAMYQVIPKDVGKDRVADPTIAKGGWRGEADIRASLRCNKCLVVLEQRSFILAAATQRPSSLLHADATHRNEGGGGWGGEGQRWHRSRGARNLWLLVQAFVANGWTALELEKQQKRGSEGCGRSAGVEDIRW